MEGQVNFPSDSTSNTRHQKDGVVFDGCVWETQEEVAAAKVKRRGELQGKLRECQQRLAGLVQNGPHLGVDPVMLVALLQGQGALSCSFRRIVHHIPCPRGERRSGGARPQLEVLPRGHIPHQLSMHE